MNPIIDMLARADPDSRPFALLSGSGAEELSRWSWFFCGDRRVVHSLEEAACAARSGDPWPRAVGWINYDQGLQWVDPPMKLRRHPFDEPPLEFHVFEGGYGYDHRSERLFSFGVPPRVPERAPPPRGRLTEPLRPRWSWDHYARRFSALLAMIRDGEVYQANLTYPLLGRFEGDARAAFLRLAASAPPFAAYLQRGSGRAVVSASPECLLRYDAQSRWAATFPIKGARPRGADPAEDARNREELSASEKDRAEHMMIVDLLRNDLGRTAEYGSVHVDPLAYVESFSRVHHITSAVRGRSAQPGHEVLRALFPGGSITGAPKLRAMELIDDLEGEARGLYTGSIALLHGDGSVTASITIRTAEIASSELRMGVGGGIVIDSEAEDEWAETQVKARALSEALTG